MSDLRADLEALINRAMADGGAVIPIDVLRDLLEHGPRPAPLNHEIVFPGYSHTWLMRHPAECAENLRCVMARVASHTFHTNVYEPGEHIAELYNPVIQAIRTRPLYQIGQSQ